MEVTACSWRFSLIVSVTALDLLLIIFDAPRFDWLRHLFINRRFIFSVIKCARIIINMIYNCPRNSFLSCWSAWLAKIQFCLIKTLTLLEIVCRNYILCFFFSINNLLYFLLNPSPGTPTQPTQTSLSRLQDVLRRSRRLTTKQDVVTTCRKRRWIYDVWIYDVLKTSDLRCLEDVQFATSWKRLIYKVFRTSDLRRLRDAWFMTSWRRL